MCGFTDIKNIQYIAGFVNWHSLSNKWRVILRSITHILLFLSIVTKMSDEPNCLKHPNYATNISKLMVFPSLISKSTFYWGYPVTFSRYHFPFGLSSRSSVSRDKPRTTIRNAVPTRPNFETHPTHLLSVRIHNGRKRSPMRYLPTSAVCSKMTSFNWDLNLERTFSDRYHNAKI